MLNKNEAIDKLSTLKEVAISLESKQRGSQEFQKWKRDTQVALEKIFGEDTRHSKDFNSIRYSLSAFTSGTHNSAFQDAYMRGIRNAATVLESIIDEIEEYWDKSEQDTVEEPAVEKVELLINRFHQVARQIRSRYASRDTLEIEDEYDVQDLFHSLLKIYFDDVRAEEYTPSYAGAASRVDFLLKDEQIVIEIKKTRKGLSAKEVGEQLIIDTQRYQAHPNCNHLICFVYDPEARISNPRGIENDLTKITDGLPVSVFIRPE